MKNTNIEWTDHTLNFWWGCTKVSPACAHCYAESVANVFGKRLFGYVPRWGVGMARAERLEKARAEALAIQKRAKRDQDGFEENAVEARKHGAFIDVPPPRRPRVFVNSMSDWLDDEVPLEWLAYLLETLAMCPNVDFQLLTKRPENWRLRVLACNSVFDDQDTAEGDELRDWTSEWIYGQAPANLWIGTTVENQEQADKRIPALLGIPARVRFLSCEPLLGPVRFIDDPLRNVEGKIVLSACTGLSVIAKHLGGNATSFQVGIEWIIAGGESGGNARPSHPDWFRSLRDQCAGAGVAFFFKQWGEWISLDHMTPEMDRRAYPGHRFDDTPEGLILRAGTKHTGRLLDGVEHSAFPQSLTA